MRQLLILPFGYLPLILLAAYLLWKVLEATAHRLIINDHRFGTTEFPSEVSTLLNGTNHNELAFGEDGKTIILTIQRTYRDLPDNASAQQYIKELLYEHDDVEHTWVDQLTVTHVTPTEQPGGYKVTIMMPRSTVLSMNYIENEIKNLGRVFTRNTTNNHRFILSQQQVQHIDVRDGRVLVRIDRRQLVPTFLGNWKKDVMSERQITRNIKNRLWNQVDVRCISIDQQTYCGEIILPALH